MPSLPLKTFRSSLSCPCGIWTHARIGHLMLKYTPEGVRAELLAAVERRA